MPMSSDELRATIEAILFVSGEPVSLDRLKEALPGESREEIAAEIEKIRTHFDDHVGGFGLEEAGGGFRFASRPAHDSVIRKFFAKQGEGRLSLAALETLAIIAYRQPITAPEISDIRGVNTSGVLRTLLDRRMIRIAGRKAVVGSPFLYRTTREFLMHFGLNSVQDLPRLEEFADLLGENVGEEFLTEAPLETAGEIEASEAAASPDSPGDGSDDDERAEDDATVTHDRTVADDETVAIDETVPVDDSLDDPEIVEDRGDDLTSEVDDREHLQSAPSEEGEPEATAGEEPDDDAGPGEEIEEDRAGSRERQ